MSRPFETAVSWAPHDQDASRAYDHIREEAQARFGFDPAEPNLSDKQLTGPIESTVDDASLGESMLRTESARERAEAVELMARAHRADLEAEQSQLVVIEVTSAERDELVGMLRSSVARTVNEIEDFALDPELAVEPEDLDELEERRDRRTALANQLERTQARVAEKTHESEVAWDSAERSQAHAASLDGKANAEAISAWRQADSDNAKHPREAVRRAGGKSPKARKSRHGGDREMQCGRGR